MDTEKITIVKDNNTVKMSVHTDIIKDELENKLNESDIKRSFELTERTKKHTTLMAKLLAMTNCPDNCKALHNEYNTEFASRCCPTGNISAEIMFLNKMPTLLEYRTLTSHTDTEGLFITLILEKLGYKREDVYMTDFIKCYAPNLDGDSCIECAVHHFFRELYLVKPKILVCEGLGVLKALAYADVLSGLPKTLEYGKIYDVKILECIDLKVTSIYDLNRTLEKTGQDYADCKQKLWIQLVNIRESLKNVSTDR